MTTATQALPFKLGKLPAREGATALKLANYVDPAVAIPQIPAVFGHYQLVKQYPMYANDQWGCCVFSGAGHETQVFVAEGQNTVSFTDKNILDAYSAVTGFDINDPSTDQGTDMERAAAWRRKVGIRDSSGKRHKVAAYIALDPGNVNQVALAGYYFGGAGVGLRLPQFAMDAFDKNGAKTVWGISKKNIRILGGHYVSVLGRNAKGNFMVATWGQLIQATPEFIAEYMDEGLAYVSLEVLYSGVNLNGMNQTQLLADLRRVTSVRVPAPSDVGGHRPSTVTPAKGKPPPPAKKAAPRKSAARKAPAKTAAKKAQPRKRAR